MNHLFLYEAFWEAPEQSLPSIFWKAFITSLRDTWKEKVAHSCPTLCDPMDYTVHGILQASILEWVAYPFSRGSSPPRNWTRVSCIAGETLASWAAREPALFTAVSARFTVFRTWSLSLISGTGVKEAFHKWPEISGVTGPFIKKEKEMFKLV